MDDTTRHDTTRHVNMAQLGKKQTHESIPIELRFHPNRRLHARLHRSVMCESYRLGLDPASRT
eukprot:scaffold213666_cov35-Attheya_sp.AAC.1